MSQPQPGLRTSPQRPCPRVAGLAAQHDVRRSPSAPILWIGLAPVLRGLLLCLLGALVAGCASSPDKRVLQYLNTHGFGNRYSGDAEEENYVTIGDGFSWFNEFDPSINGQAQIDIDGTVVLPQVGSVHVAGMTRSELETYLSLQLSRYFADVNIRIQQLNTQRKVYYVFGEVGNDGSKAFEGELTIFDAVMQAQPTEYVANLGRVRLVRGDPRDPTIITVDISDILNGDTTFNVLVKERDIIIVPPTMIGRISNFLGALITPFAQVLQQLTQSLFLANRANNFGAVGGFGNNNNNNNNLF